MFHPSLHALDPVELMLCDQAAAHFDEAERELAAVRTTLETVWAETAWQSPAAQAFRIAVLDMAASVAGLHQSIAASRWEAGV